MEEIRKQYLWAELKEMDRKSALLERAVMKARIAVEVEEAVMARKRKTLEVTQRDHLEVMEQRHEVWKKLHNMS